eukprot:snap_masked-scaffold_9-processed-gene-1.30-mRNA-1 protein AED:0.12 eAED:1.00 QI:0/0/0/1/1/1/3/0/432
MSETVTLSETRGMKELSRLENNSEEFEQLLKDEENSVIVRTMDKKSSNATVTSTSLNLMNNLIGAGVLSLPSCFKDASVIGGTIVLIFVSILSVVSMILIAICCEKTNCYSFAELGENCVAFLILLGDFFAGPSGIIQSVEDEFHLEGEKTNLFNILVYDHNSRFFVIGFITFFVLFPLSCKKDLNSLKFTSVLSALGTLAWMMRDTSNLIINWFDLSFDIFTAAPIINVAFVCHYNVPKYYQELHPKIRSIKNFSKAVVCSYVLTFFAYFFIALFGYLSFGDFTQGDILKNFSDDDKYAILARFCLALVVLFTYPFAFNALRISFLSFLPLMGIKVSDSWFISYTGLLVLYTFIPGAYFTNIAVVLDYKGALLGGAIGFGFVGLFFLRIIKKDIDIRRTSTWRKWSYVLIIWTLVTSILGVVVTTKKLLHG